jgi:hypothetical protein
MDRESRFSGVSRSLLICGENLLYTPSSGAECDDFNPHISQGWWILRGRRIVEVVDVEIVGMLYVARTPPFPPEAAEMEVSSARRQEGCR